MGQIVTLNLKIPRNTDVTPEAAKTFLSALTQINPTSSFERLLGKKQKAFSWKSRLSISKYYFL
jgi:hypothetical protein